MPFVPPLNADCKSKLMRFEKILMRLRVCEKAKQNQSETKGLAKVRSHQYLAALPVDNPAKLPQYADVLGRMMPADELQCVQEQLHRQVRLFSKANGYKVVVPNAVCPGPGLVARQW